MLNIILNIKYYFYIKFYFHRETIRFNSIDNLVYHEIMMCRKVSCEWDHVCNSFFM